MFSACLRFETMYTWYFLYKDSVRSLFLKPAQRPLEFASLQTEYRRGNSIGLTKNRTGGK